MKSLAIYFSELRANFVWHAAWLATFTGFLLLLVEIYPGDKTMQVFLTLMQTSAYFEDLLGKFGSSSAGFSLWVSMMFPFMVIFLLIYAMTTGVRAAIQSVSDGTGELFHTLPVSRSGFISTRAISNFTYIIIYFIIQTIIFSIPFTGHTLKINYLVNIAWWGLLFSLFGLLIGMLMGLLAGNSTKGHQLSIILILVFYSFQILTRININLSSLDNINPLTYYQPDQYLIGLGFVKNEKLFGITYYYYPVALFLFSIVLFIMCLMEFNRKDLSNDAGLHFNFFKRLSLTENRNFSVRKSKILGIVISPFIFIKDIFFPKNVRNNPFVFWARIFENNLPITADFIYSDNMLLFIAFLAIFFFFPFQIGYYPGDAISRNLALNTSGGVFSILTYGHNLVAYPYLYYLVSNTIGVTWIIIVPLCFFWVRKAIRTDGNSGTGEIFGGIPLKSKTIVFQRLFAIFIELVFLIALMIFWLVLCEAFTNETFNKIWEIYSLLGMIPLYIFLISITFILSLEFKQKGGFLSGILLIGIVISFIISVLNNNLNTWYFRGIFGLYDPVDIIQNSSFLANNGGLVYLTVLSIISICILILTASKFTWLNITNKSENSEN